MTCQVPVLLCIVVLGNNFKYNGQVSHKISHPFPPSSFFLRFLPAEDIFLQLSLCSTKFLLSSFSWSPNSPNIFSPPSPAFFFQLIYHYRQSLWIPLGSFILPSSSLYSSFSSFEITTIFAIRLHSHFQFSIHAKLSILNANTKFVFLFSFLFLVTFQKRIPHLVEMKSWNIWCEFCNFCKTFSSKSFSFKPPNETHKFFDIIVALT